MYFMFFTHTVILINMGEGEGEGERRERGGEKTSGCPRQLIDVTTPIDLN